jgi:4a-hydroxytetrahydrobiopterin dehydratase
MFKEENNRLKANFKFEDFITAFSFMTEVAFWAEKQAHHPNWTNVYNTVEIELTTHDAGNIVTQKDHTLAKKITQLYAKYQ